MRRFFGPFAAAGLVAGLCLTYGAARAGAVTGGNNLAPWVQQIDSPSGCTSACADSPPARAAYAGAYDAGTGTFLVFGGLSGSEDYADFNDTWSWNGTTWAQVGDTGDSGCIDSCTASPPERAASAMAYDPATHQLILFGGQGASSYLNDTWDWNGSTWTQVADSGDAGCTEACTASPPAETGEVLAYDQATRQLLLVTSELTEGDDATDTWDWNGTAWTDLSPATNPPGSVAADMAYDPASGQLVFFGGQDYAGNDTWTWNGSTWTQVDDAGNVGCGQGYPTANPCADSPLPVSGASMAFDPGLGGLVLFGGLGTSDQYDSTWLWNGSAWSQIDDTGAVGCGNAVSDPCSAVPPPRSTASLVYDSASGQLVMFGGQGGNSYGGPFLNDTWTIAAGGYSLTDSRGAVFSFGSTFEGSLPGSGIHLDDIVGVAASPSGGYWLVSATGGVYSFGAPFEGSLPGAGIHLDDIVGVAADPSGDGYWLVSATGGVYGFGAPFEGSLPGAGIHLDDIVGVAASPSGGYWLVSATGGVYSFDAPYEGSLPGAGTRVDDIVGVAADPSGGGYWLASSSGAVNNFGVASEGSLPGLGIDDDDIVGIVASAGGGGYWLVGSYGGVFNFGSARYTGSLPGRGISDDSVVGGAA